MFCHITHKLARLALGEPEVVVNPDRHTDHGRGLRIQAAHSTTTPMRPESKSRPRLAELPSNTDEFHGGVEL